MVKTRIYTAIDIKHLYAKEKIFKNTWKSILLRLSHCMLTPSKYINKMRPQEKGT